MFTADNITWVGGPVGQGRWSIYPYTTKEGGKLHFWMNQEAYAVYSAERDILDILADEHINQSLLAEAIVKYGDARAEVATQREIENNVPILGIGLQAS